MSELFPMSFTQEFTVLRAQERPDPYNPATTVTDWANPQRFTVDGFIASLGSSEVGGEPGQRQLNTRKILTVPTPNADIQRGDRIEAPDGAVYEVQGYPARDMNPFTGWNPTTVVDLQEITG